MFDITCCRISQLKLLQATCLLYKRILHDRMILFLTIKTFAILPRVCSAHPAFHVVVSVNKKFAPTSFKLCLSAKAMAFHERLLAGLALCSGSSFGTLTPPVGSWKRRKTRE